MRRLLIVTHAFPPSPAAGAARAWRFYKYLQEFGYETYVVTGSPQHQSEPRVTWVPIPPRNLGERILCKFALPSDEDIQWTLPAFHAAERLIAATPMDAVLSTVPYIQDHIIGYRLKKKFNLPWIADYRDPIVGNPFRQSTGIPGLSDRFLNARFFASADLLVSVTDYAKRAWILRSPEVASKSVVVWNGYDPEEIIAPKPIPPRSYRLISHIGSFYSGRSPVTPLLSAFRLILRGTLNPARFRFRLLGALSPAIAAANSELFQQLTKLGCLEFQPVRPRQQALDAMMESDSLLLADNNDASIGQTVPAKIFEYIRVGRPILALTVYGSPVERILGISGVPFVTLYPNLGDELIDARMLEFLSLPTAPVDLSEQFLIEFNGRNQACTLAGLIDRILDPLNIGSTLYDRNLDKHTKAV